MSGMRRSSNLLFVFLIGCLLNAVSAMAWDETSQENILVFDAQGESVATYHLGNWTTNANEIDDKVYFEVWQAGSPPTLVGTDAASVLINSQQTAIPNRITGASTPPPPGVPEVSLYSFDPALFDSNTPGNIPGLSASPSPGTYDHTIALELKAVALTGTPVVEIWDQAVNKWIASGNPVTRYIAFDQTIRARANNDGALSAEKVLAFTIEQSALVDSDHDGFPDIWEIHHGLNPLSADNNLTGSDRDGDGVFDLDEILRGTDPDDPNSFPADSDNDGWSDWDETLRGTNPNDINDKPTATSLYEVERLLAGTVFDQDLPDTPSSYEVETLSAVPLTNGTTDGAGRYACRVPAGNEAVIRTSNLDFPRQILKRYLPGIADPKPADLNFTAAQCGGTLADCWQDWQAAWILYLGEHLVVSTANYDVQQQDMLPIALLERQLEILAGAIPAEVAERLPVDTPEEPWLAFAAHGHRPQPSLVEALKQRLAQPTTLEWLAAPDNIQPPRTINELMVDLAEIASPCTTLEAQVLTLYDTYGRDTTSESRVSRLLQEPTGTYLAGLLLAYSKSAIDRLPVTDACLALDPLGDFDGDGLANNQEVPLTATPTGLADPFKIDTDGDQIFDNTDNCPSIYNPDQRDWDGDGRGDLCDDDDDNDNLSDAVETAFGANPFNADTNDDGETDDLAWLNGTDAGIAVYATTYLSPYNLPEQIIGGVREADAVVAVTIDNGAVAGEVSYPTATTWSCALANMLIETTYQVALSATDPNDPTRAGKGSLTIIIDASDPQVAIASPADGQVLDNNSPLLVFTADAGTVEIRLDGQLLAIASGDHLPVLEDGFHTVSIMLTNLYGNLGTASSTFRVETMRTPIADAGPDQTVRPGTLLTLNGRNSIDPHDQITAYNWSQLDGEPVTLSDPTAAEPVFFAPANQGSLAFTLTVTNSLGESASATCLVNVTEADLPPTADAGPDHGVVASSSVQLDGNASSDPEGAPLTFNWQQIQGPLVSLSEATVASPEFTAPTVSNLGASLVFELTVSDALGLRARDRVIITVEELNGPPSAVCQIPPTVLSGEVVDLDATLSADSDGAITTYHWQQVTGSPATLNSPISSQSGFIAPATTTSSDRLRFRLTVGDDGLLLGQDECQVTVYTLDRDGDGDYDGSDLADLLRQEPAMTAEEIAAFADQFGR